jgi:hypothetical protein
MLYPIFMEKMGPKSLIETCQHQAKLAVQEFKDAGWKVRTLSPGRVTAPALKGSILWFVCGDGRYAGFFQENDCPISPDQTVAVFGGGYSIIALTGKSLHEARAFAQQSGFDIRLHGDTHGPSHSNAPLNCGFFGKWKEGKIPGVSPLKVPPEQMLEIARTMGVPVDIIPGDHEESALYLNYAPDRIVIPHVDRFRTDAWVPLRLGLPDVARFSRQTIESLSDKVRTATIITP